MHCPRVVLADDHDGVLEYVARLLNSGLEIVGKVADGLELVRAVDRLDPDLVILDIAMPVLDGLKAASRIRQSGAKARLIFLTVHDDPDFVDAAFSAGAQGYVTKLRFATDLLPAIHAVLQGNTFVSPSISR